MRKHAKELGKSLYPASIEVQLTKEMKIDLAGCAHARALRVAALCREILKEWLKLNGPRGGRR